jgi:hypothetical protein
MKEAPDEQSLPAGVRRVIGAPVGVVQRPMQRWLERRAERSAIEERSEAVKREAGERMREFHEVLWDRWGPEAINHILEEGKETK